MERTRTATNVPPLNTAELPRGHDLDRTDWALMGIDLVAVVVLGAGLITAFLGR